MSLKYRPEIDGLRAFAVGTVVLYHADVSGFAGGFIGVDVFFVLSGFLITAILIREIEDGRYSLATFYNRRARRILPALFVVIATTLIVARPWMLPWQYEELSLSALSAVFFVSNFFFWRTSGYFDAGVEEKPLLHTWSLAVEEQYYILFPVLLFLILPRSRRMTVTLLVAATLASLALAEWGWRTYPQANFFVSPTRVWEILIGSIAAFVPRPRLPRPVRETVSALALLTVLASLLVFDTRTPVPSLAILPTLIAVAVVLVFARDDTWAARFLAFRPFVAVGMISYSLYLWHQPVMALYRVRFGQIEAPGVTFGLIALSVALAVASYHLVERPFRAIGPSGQHRIPARRMIAALGSGAAVLAAAGVLAVVEIGNGRYRMADIPNTNAMIDVRSERARSWNIFVRNKSLKKKLSSFETSDPATIRVLILGDSHAKDLFNALQQNADLFPEFEFRVAFFTDGCMSPALSIDGNRACLEAFVKDKAALTTPARVVLFSASWGKSDPQFVADVLPVAVDVFQAQGKHVALASNTPVFEPSGPHLIGQLFREGRLEKAAADRLFFESRRPSIDEINAVVEQVSRETGAAFLDKQAYLCEAAARRCTALTPSGHAVLSDADHLTVEGARYLGGMIRELNWLAPERFGG